MTNRFLPLARTGHTHMNCFLARVLGICLPTRAIDCDQKTRPNSPYQDYRVSLAFPHVVNATEISQLACLLLLFQESPHEKSNVRLFLPHPAHAGHP